MSKARYVMIGGFLGAGKSTSILQIAKQLSTRYKVGLITNDQGASLVDTATFTAGGFAVEEISGGCFCCRFTSLMEAAQKLQKETTPDIFIAEPVGSCTDLIATVSYPLRRIYGNEFSIAPLSVVVDPIRAMRILDLQPGKKFSPKVSYIYLKQLEEADIIVINKTDLLEEQQLISLQKTLEERFPNAEIISVSARHSHGVEQWIEEMMKRELGTATPMEIDYKIYAEGEALLGWLNCSVKLKSDYHFDGNDFLQKISQNIKENLPQTEIAHLKMTLLPDGGNGQIGVVNLVRNDGVPEVSQTLLDYLKSGDLTVNLRAEGDAQLLYDTVQKVLSEYQQQENIEVIFEHKEFFQPSEPVPTYRDKQAN
ncbi:GTP-binding protein [Candidatus Uabimicrobium sp. HlEnr_7]|uniref:GTP-binding protein n=1 Tax=Candidatus Uabimicrobium helgolandensis TaxID=3095367 RepID=UPI003556C6E8